MLEPGLQLHHHRGGDEVEARGWEAVRNCALDNQRQAAGPYDGCGGRDGQCVDYLSWERFVMNHG